jgi:glycosyltransferase involved in cell wall biosynthesis
MVTYNHSKFISQAIEGVLSQKTDFRVKLFIGEDCSEDNTREICQKYVDENPGRIELICTRQNNMWDNSNNIWKACKDSGAKYLALCEGDDFWTDPLKLQKQVDFLDANPDFALSFSASRIVDKDGKDLPKEGYFPTLTKDVLTIEDFILSYVSVIPTASVIYRNILPFPLPDFYLTTMSGDILITLLIAHTGKAKYFEEEMSAYRIHSGGVTQSKLNRERGNDSLIKMYKNMDAYLGWKYHKAFRKRFLENAKVKLIFGAKNKKGIERLVHYFKLMPEYIRYSDTLNIKEIIYYTGILFFNSLLKKYKKPTNSENKQG